MLRRLRETGPGLLVPLAWTFVTAAHLDLVGTDPLFVAHVVMDVIIVGFTVLSWREMATGVLRAWRTVLVVGLVPTLVGTAGLLASPPNAAMLAVSVVGWTVVPVPALAYTGRHVDEAPTVYLAGAALSGAGAVVYVAATALGAGTAAVVAGLTLVNVGQTAGIWNAVYQY